MNMTDAEIKELAIKHGFEGHGKLICYDGIICHEELIEFAHELEALDREKVLTELAKDNPAVATFQYCGGHYEQTVCPVKDASYIKDSNIDMSETFPLYAMPPVPEGWQLVPIVADVPLREKMQSIFRIGFGDTKRKWAELLEAAPKKG